jgi:hypothetical protein
MQLGHHRNRIGRPSPFVATAPDQTGLLTDLGYFQDEAAAHYYAARTLGLTDYTVGPAIA